MTPEGNLEPAGLLETVVGALERGDWRTATLVLSTGTGRSDRPEIVAIVFCLRCVTHCIQSQSTLGEVEAASYQLDSADRALIPYRDQILAESAPDPGVERLLWDTNRLVQRERADLLAVRRIFEGLRRGRPELVYACIEFLTFVAFDPWTVRISEEDQELTDLDDDAYARWRTGNRHDLCARATALRQYADAWTGTVSERTWTRAGGYPALFEDALRVLAGEQETRGRLDLPIRRGRIRAWGYARDWMTDTAA